MNIKASDLLLSSGTIKEALRTPQGFAFCVFLIAVAGLIKLSRTNKQRTWALVSITFVMFVGMTGSLISWYVLLRSAQDVEYIQYLWGTEQGRRELARRMKTTNEGESAADLSAPVVVLQEAGGNEFVDDIFDGGVEIVNSSGNKFQGSAFINGQVRTATSRPSR